MSKVNEKFHPWQPCARIWLPHPCVMRPSALQGRGRHRAGTTFEPAGSLTLGVEMLWHNSRVLNDPLFLCPHSSPVVGPISSLSSQLKAHKGLLPSPLQRLLIVVFFSRPKLIESCSCKVFSQVDRVPLGQGLWTRTGMLTLGVLKGYCGEGNVHAVSLALHLLPGHFG